MIRAFRHFLTAAAIVLAALAIWDQLVRGPAFRTWHGEVFGVPYDFRRPTPGKVIDALWAPERNRLLSPHVFGVGWTLNIGYIYTLYKRPIST